MQYSLYGFFAVNAVVTTLYSVNKILFENEYSFYARQVSQIVDPKTKKKLNELNKNEIIEFLETETKNQTAITKNFEEAKKKYDSAQKSLTKDKTNIENSKNEKNNFDIRLKKIKKLKTTLESEMIETISGDVANKEKIKKAEGDLSSFFIMQKNLKQHITNLEENNKTIEEEIKKLIDSYETNQKKSSTNNQAQITEVVQTTTLNNDETTSSEYFISEECDGILESKFKKYFQQKAISKDQNPQQGSKTSELKFEDVNKEFKHDFSNKDAKNFKMYKENLKKITESQKQIKDFETKKNKQFGNWKNFVGKQVFDGVKKVYLNFLKQVFEKANTTIEEAKSGSDDEMQSFESQQTESEKKVNESQPLVEELTTKLSEITEKIKIITSTATSTA